MTILSSVYASTTSLMSFSQALNVVSDNVANLNTIGFRATDPLFTSLPGVPDRADQSPIGEGTQFVTSGRRFLLGEIRQTGNNTDLAINGEGFFVLARDGITSYTRFGQFELDDSRRLIDPISGAALQGVVNGRQSDLVIDLDRLSPSSPTTAVSFGGSLSSADETHTVNNITVFDAAGQPNRLTMTLTKLAVPLGGEVVWSVEVKDEQGTVLNSPLSSTIRFSSTGGAPLAGFNTLEIPIGTGEAANTVRFDFGDPSGSSGVQAVASGTSAITVAAADGAGVGQVVSYEFNASGALILKFSNGKSETAGQVILASFNNPKLLESADGRLFTTPSDLQPVFGTPANGALGSLAPRSVELANVELAKEFSDIIILQRGYQASSQILNVASEMIQDVYNSVSGRR